MKNIVKMIALIGLFGCVTPGDYKLYRRDKSIYYPKEKLGIKITNDSTGIFTNVDLGRDALNQYFKYQKVDDKYLLVKEVSPNRQDLISLSQGDTLMIQKNQLHFFYNGKRKYLLSFKSK